MFIIEARNNVLVEQSPLGITLLNRENTMVYTNPAFERMLDGAPGEFVGKPYMDLVHPDDQEGSRLRLSRAQAPEHARLSLREQRLVTPRGQIVEVESTGTVVVRNGEVLIMLIFQDITERKIAEAALEESEKRFLDVMHSSEDAILFLNENAILDCNDAALRLFRQNSREAMLHSTPWHELSPPVQPDGRSGSGAVPRQRNRTPPGVFRRKREIRGDRRPREILTRSFFHGGKKFPDVPPHTSCRSAASELLKKAPGPDGIVGPWGSADPAEMALREALFSPPNRLRVPGCRR